MANYKDVQDKLRTFCQLWDAREIPLASVRRILVYEAAMQVFENETPFDMASAVGNFSTGGPETERLLRDLYLGRGKVRRSAETLAYHKAHWKFEYKFWHSEQIGDTEDYLYSYVFTDEATGHCWALHTTSDVLVWRLVTDQAAGREGIAQTLTLLTNRAASPSPVAGPKASRLTRKY